MKSKAWYFRAGRPYALKFRGRADVHNRRELAALLGIPAQDITEAMMAEHFIPVYLREAWRLMVARCHDQRHAMYRHYGGRGIKVCPEWRDDVRRFAADVGPRPSSAFSLDRIDNERGYELGNVRWATRSQQSANQRKWRVLTKPASIDGLLSSLAWG